MSLCLLILFVLQGLDCRGDLRKYNYKHFVVSYSKRLLLWLKTKACKSVSVGFFLYLKLVDL